MDQERLRRMLEEHHTSAWGWTLACCKGNQEEAFDVLHTAYVQILEGKARFAERSSFKTWLFAVIRYTASRRRFRFFQKLKRFVDFPAKAVAFQRSAEEEIFRSELRSRIGEILGRLSKRQQEVLHLVFYQQLTVEQAAGVMGVSLGSARTHYQRGKERLRVELTRAGLSDEYIRKGFEDQKAV